MIFILSFIFTHISLSWATPSIHSESQLRATLDQFIDDYKKSGLSLFAENEKSKKKTNDPDLNYIFEYQTQINIPAEAIAHKIFTLTNGGSILFQKYNSFLKHVDLKDSDTYNALVAEMIQKYYQDPTSRDAIYIIASMLSSELKAELDLGHLPVEDSITQSALNWTMFASALIVIRDAARERGGFVEIWNKYFKKTPQMKMLSHRSLEQLPPRSAEHFSPPTSAHRQKCKNWIYGKKTTEEFIELQKVLSRGKSSLLGGLDSLCVSGRIGAEAFIKGGLVAGGIRTLGEWEEHKYDPLELLRPFIYFSVHNLALEMHALFLEEHELFLKWIKQNDRTMQEKITILKSKLNELKKQEQHLITVAPELVLGKISQPLLLNSLDDYRKKWKLTVILDGIHSKHRLAQLINDSEKLQELLEEYYRTIENENNEGQDKISLAPIQGQREIIEKELNYLVSQK